jgi:capsular polysaccharide biosynthesis protein
MKNHSIEYEDEIELIDLLRVIWKWKYFIVLGTILITVVVGITSYLSLISQTKKYITEMVIKPAVINFDKKGNEVFIDTPNNIKAIIESGEFDNQIIKHLKESNEIIVNNPLKFKVIVLKKLNLINIKYESSDNKSGKHVLNYLIKAIKKQYTEKIAFIKTNYKKEFEERKYTLNELKKDKELKRRSIINIEQFISNYEDKIKIINENTEKLIQKGNVLIKEQRTINNDLSYVLLMNSVVQNLGIENKYHDGILLSSYKKEELEFDLYKIEKTIHKIDNEITEIENKINNIRTFTILQHPASSPLTLKSNINRNIVLAIVTGLFFMLFLAFFGEYISKHMKKEKQ